MSPTPTTKPKVLPPDPVTAVSLKARITGARCVSNAGLRTIDKKGIDVVLVDLVCPRRDLIEEPCHA